MSKQAFIQQYRDTAAKLKDAALLVAQGGNAKMGNHDLARAAIACMIVSEMEPAAIEAALDRLEGK